MILRVYTGDDGQSHFQELDLPTNDWEPVALKPGADAVFRCFPEGDFHDWHNESRRQYAGILTGEVRFEIGDGSTRTLYPGGVALGEDLTGQGHTSTIVKGPSSVIFLPLPD